MNRFNLYEVHKDYFTPKIISLITRLYQHKGRLEIFAETRERELAAMNALAELQSTASSCRMDGIPVITPRLEQLALGKSEPRNFSEEEILGCLQVIRSVSKTYDYIPCKSYYILQLHRDLFSFSRMRNGGLYREDSDFDTEKALDQLFDSYESAFESPDAQPLILIPMLMLNFLKIQPFSCGNGRMGRLLAFLCLLKNGFAIGKYASLDRIMEDTDEEFRDALEDSSTAWNDNVDAYEPFILWFLETLINAQDEFERRTEHLRENKKPKAELIEDCINKIDRPFTKKDIMNLLPEISEVTVERTLLSMCRQEKIRKKGASRGTFYEKNR